MFCRIQKRKQKLTATQRTQRMIPKKPEMREADRSHINPARAPKMAPASSFSRTATARQTGTTSTGWMEPMASSPGVVCTM